MSDNGFPDLSKWHVVPEGVKIPAGVRYAAKWSDESVSVRAGIEGFTPTSNVRYVTEKPIPPTPDEPTREAAVVRFSDGNDNYLATLTDRPSLWLSEYHDNYDVEPLVSWVDILGAATPGSIEVLFKGVGE